MRKVTTEANQERRRMQAPWEFSAHKYKQECEFREKQAAYRAKMMQMAAAQRAAQSAQPGVSGMPQQPGRPVMGPMSGASPGLASAVPHPGYPNGVPQGRPGSAQAFMNGGPFNNNLNNAQMRPGAVNVPQAQMQPYIQTQQRMAQQQQQQQQQPATADSVRVIMEATRLQEEQRRLAQSQYNAQAGNMNGHMPQANLAAQNAAMMANLQRANGKPSPAGGASPGLAHAQQLSSGMVPVLNQIAQALRQQFPNLSMEQINSMATVQLNKTLRSHNALQMQAGGPANGMQMSPQQQHAMAAYGGQGLNPQLNPQMYAQYMRSQQSQQQRQNPSMGNGMEMSSPRPNSRGDMMPNTNGVMNGGTPRPSQSQSPRPPQAQMTGQ
jgi:chromatin modification-related protein VID21